MFETITNDINNTQMKSKINEIVHDNIPEGLDEEERDELIEKRLIRMMGELNEYKEFVESSVEKQVEIIKTVMKESENKPDFGGKKSRKGKRNNRNTRKRFKLYA